jgi:hypothetical protein
VVVGHLDVIGVMLLPSETDAPLVVDANATLTLTVAAKLFQAVGRRHAQEVECVRRIQGLRLGVGTAMDVRGRLRTRRPKNRAAVAFSAKLLITRPVSYVKRVP